MQAKSFILSGRGRTRKPLPENPVLLSLQGNAPPAILALADGTVYVGNSIGATGSTVGARTFASVQRQTQPTPSD